MRPLSPLLLHAYYPNKGSFSPPFPYPPVLSISSIQTKCKRLPIGDLNDMICIHFFNKFFCYIKKEDLYSLFEIAMKDICHTFLVLTWVMVIDLLYLLMNDAYFYQ